MKPSLLDSTKQGVNKVLKYKKATLEILKSGLFTGDPGGIRTPDPRLRRPLLYPTELLNHVYYGAGDGNRTHNISLEG